MTLLKAHMASVADSERHHVERSQDLRTILTGQGTRIEALHERVGKVETEAREAKDTAAMASNSAVKALREHDALKGALMVEVGKLATNDKNQNDALKSIEKETGEQTEKIDVLVASESTRKTREDVVFWILTRALPAVAVGTGGAIVWLVTHYH